ncbi:MAG: SigE family polymerase sigma factor [Frankiales bacterium]|nr:SigE family polymerase sigma factor [Frankiales bacterium]
MQTLAAGAVTGTPLDDFYAAAYARLVAALTLTAGSREEAEEVVQEAFVRLVPRWDKVSRYDDPEQWVRTVAWRLATSRWRRVVTSRKALRRQGVAPDVAPPGTEALEVEELLAGLSVEHRQVLVLHYGLGLSVEDCAAELRIPPGTVKSRLSRAREAARSQEKPQ